jgi:hypothetical protein
MSSKLRLANKVIKDLFVKHNVKYKISETDREFLGDLDFDIYVDLSKYHRLGENFDESYRDFFDNFLEDEIVESLEMVGLEEDFNQITFHHENREVGILMKRIIQDKLDSTLKRLGGYSSYDKFKIKSLKLQDYRPGYEVVIENPKSIVNLVKNTAQRQLSDIPELEDIIIKFI